MKKILSITAILFGAMLAFAQVPEKMSYQAVIKNGSGDVIQNQNVAVKVSVLQGSDTGTVVYSERLTGTTNSNGVLALEIGTGTVLSGTFGTIEWASGNFWLKTETDLTGGTNYTIAGTSQLLSVPYAMYAKIAGNSVPGGINVSEWTTAGNNIYNSNTGNVGIGTTNPDFPLTVAKTSGEGIVQQSEDGAVKIGFWTSTGSAYLQTSSNHDLRFATNNGDAQMTLQKGTGNLGIGTTNPSAKLTVKSTADGMGITQESLMGNVKAGMYTDEASAYIQTHSNTDLSFATNNQTAQMTLQKGTGNLGIGKTNPSEKLDVNGKTKTTNLQVTSDAGEGKVLTSDANGNATWQTMKMPYSENIRFGYRFYANNLGGTRSITELFKTSNQAYAELVNVNGVDYISLHFQKKGLYHIDFIGVSSVAGTPDATFEPVGKFTAILRKYTSTPVIWYHSPYIRTADDTNVASLDAPLHQGFDYYVNEEQSLYLQFGAAYRNITNLTRNEIHFSIFCSYISE